MEGHKDLARDPHTGTIINVNSLDYQHYIASRNAKNLKNEKVESMEQDLANLKGEIGIDIILPNSFSLFLIYERNQAIDTGHTDKVHIAIGYLPNKETNYAFTIEGSENLLSKLELKKNINGFNLGFNIKDDLANSGDYKEANFTLNKVF